MLKLIVCELAKLKRKPLFCISVLLSALMPIAIEIFFPSETNAADAVDNMMSSLIQLSAYLLLMPLNVILAANLLFEEQDHSTLKNLLTVPVDKARLAIAKMLILLLFSLGFMAAGGLLGLAFLLLEGWKPAGFWPLFGVGLGAGAVIWVGALPCVFLVVALNKSYIVSVIITFFYTMVNYLLSMSDFFIMQPFGLNPGTLLPGPLTFRWMFQFFEHSNPGVEMAALLERISPYFLSSAQTFGVAAGEAALFLGLIALVYKRQEA